jgi:hypothetical protein
MSSRPRADEGDVRLRAIHGDSRALADHGELGLREACGHVAGSAEIVRRGYRFYRGFGLELGGFFTRRFTLEDGRGASVTLWRHRRGERRRAGSLGDEGPRAWLPPEVGVVLTLRTTVSWRISIAACS